MGLSLVFVTAAGEIDLSFPSIIPLSGLAFAWTLQQTNFNFALAALFCIVVGLLCGLLNGYLITKLGLSSLRLYSLVDNVHLWSNRQGYDPRLSLTGGSDNKYSLLRTVSFGMNVQF
jgi:hypothetical protein